MAGFPKGSITQAIAFHIFNANLAKQKSLRGSTFPPFKAIFKTRKSPDDVSTVLSSMAALDALSSHQRPEFICARTQQEASLYDSYIPDLWQKCNAPGILTSAVSYVKQTQRNDILFVCPGFWSLLEDKVSLPKIKFCPAVKENQFAESLFPGQPRMGNTKSAAISAFAAELYVGGMGGLRSFRFGRSMCSASMRFWGGMGESDN